MSFETKFVAPAWVAPRLVTRLRQVLAADPRHPTDRVHSVYFDSPGERATDEVRNGDLYKAKLRVRWYGSSGPGAAWLERKRKLGGRRTKLRRPAPELDATLPLHHPGWLRAPHLLQEPAERSIEHLEPVLHLAYRRERFVDRASGARIAVDDDIRLLAVHPRIAHTTPPRNCPHDELVLELKGDTRQLPRGLGFLKDLGLRRRAFSKYGICRGVA